MRWHLPLLALGLLSGCTSPLIDAATPAQLESFRTQLAARAAQEDIGLCEARDVARHFAAEEITQAQGLPGRRGLGHLGECAGHLDEALARRAETQDRVGALAALLRVEAELVPAMHYAGHLTSEDPYWRAVAARSLILQKPPDAFENGFHDELIFAGTWRRKLMADPNQEVRLAALRAASDARDPEDGVALMEAARLDPDPEARLTAIMAAGATGSSALVLALKDLWARADEDSRLAIIGAWAAVRRQPAASGGLEPCTGAAATSDSPRCLAYEQLARVAQAERGLPSVIAALELLHDADPAKPTPAEHAAAGVLERAIDDNALRITVTAIEGVPLSWPDLRSAVLDAEKAQDNAIVAAALGRRVETAAPGAAEDALKKLRELARTVGPARQIAKDALVLAGDDSVVKLLEEDAGSKLTAHRIRAALAFVKLRRYGRALQLLADDDVRVRAATACALLNAAD